MPHRTAHTWRHCESLAVDKEQNSDEVEVGNYTTQAHQQQLRGRHSPSSYPLLFSELICLTIGKHDESYQYPIENFMYIDK